MLKRILAVVFSIGFVIVSVVAVNSVIQHKKVEELSKLALPNSFEAGLSISYNQKSYEIALKKQNDNITVNMEKPQSLRGLTIKLSREDLSIGLMGIQVDGANLPDGVKQTVNTVFNVLDRLERAEYSSITETDSIINLKYNIGDKEINCSYNKSTKIPLCLEVEGLLTVEVLRFNAV